MWILIVLITSIGWRWMNSPREEPIVDSGHDEDCLQCSLKVVVLLWMTDSLLLFMMITIKSCQCHFTFCLSCGGWETDSWLSDWLIILFKRKHFEAIRHSASKQKDFNNISTSCEGMCVFLVCLSTSILNVWRKQKRHINALTLIQYTIYLWNKNVLLLLSIRKSSGAIQSKC